MFGFIKKADIFLFVGLVAVGLLVAALGFGSDITVNGTGTGGVKDASKGAGEASENKIVIRVRGKEFGSYPLSKDRTIKIKKNGKTNIVKIDSGKVYMKDASCKNHVCINQGRISRPGEMIVCLPNRVVVEIVAVSKDSKGYDAVTG